MSQPVADLFVALGVRISDDDLNSLRKFEEAYNAVAQAVRRMRAEILKPLDMSSVFGDIPTVKEKTKEAARRGLIQTGPTPTVLSPPDAEEVKSPRSKGVIEAYQQVAEAATAARKALEQPIVTNAVLDELKKLQQFPEVKVAVAVAPRQIPEEEEEKANKRAAKPQIVEAKKPFWEKLSGEKSGGVGGEVLKGLLGFSTIAGAFSLAVAAFKRMVAEGSRAADTASQFTTLTGLSIQETARWQHFASVAGISPDKMLSTLNQLNVSRYKAMYTGEWGAWALPGGGVNPMQSPDKVMKDLYAAVKDMAPGEQQYWLGKVGIDPQTLYAFNRYSQELTKFSGTIASGEDVQKVRDLNAAWGELGFTISQFSVAGLSDLSDTLRPIIKTLSALFSGLTIKPIRDMILRDNPLPLAAYTARGLFHAATHVTVHQANTMNVRANDSKEAWAQVHAKMQRSFLEHADNAYRKAHDPRQSR